MTTGLRRRCHQPKRSRGKIAWNIKVAGFRHLIAEHANDSVFALGGSDQKVIEQQFGVIAA